MRPGAPYPVAIFSPGFVGVTEAYSAMLEDLASHGVVIVAVDHPHISGATSLASSAVVTVRLPADEGEVQAVMQQAAETMVEDQRELVGWLSSQDTRLLKGRLNLSRMGAFEHSLGGSSALQSARFDARVKGGMNIDGAVQGDLAVPRPKPVAFLLAETYGRSRLSKPFWRERPAPRSASSRLDRPPRFQRREAAASVLRAGPDFTGMALPDLGPIDAASAIRTTRAQVLRFFQQHVMPVAVH